MNDAEIEKLLPIAHPGEPMLLKHFEDMLCEFSEAEGADWWRLHDLLCIAYAYWAAPRDNGGSIRCATTSRRWHGN